MTPPVIIPRFLFILRFLTNVYYLPRSVIHASQSPRDPRLNLEENWYERVFIIYLDYLCMDIHWSLHLASKQNAQNVIDDKK